MAVPSPVFDLTEALISTSLVRTPSVATTRIINATLVDSINLAF